MKVSNYLDIKPVQEVPGAVMREVITADDGAPNFCMRVFEVEPGSSTPSHSHSWEHEVFVLSGRGVVKGEHGETQIARANPGVQRPLPKLGAVTARNHGGNRLLL